MSLAMHAVAATRGSQSLMPPPAYRSYMPKRREHDVVMLDIDRDESLLAPLVSACGGRWNEQLWVWELEFWTAVELGLEAWML
jgi:hypothetical protein